MSMCIVRCPKCKAYFVDPSTDWNQKRGCCKQCTPRKYRNIPTVVEGIHFDSTGESQYYQRTLLPRVRTGEIRNLVLQPKFPLVVNGVHIADYYADFQYEDVSSRKVIVEDFKSEATRKDKTYRLKKKLVEALYGIVIVEV
jgi:hypothetical protein